MSEDNRRAQLIEMVRQVQQASACVMDFDGLLGRLEQETGMRQIGQLIFDPPGGKPLTPEQIVDRVLETQSD